MRLVSLYRRRGWLLYAPISLLAVLALWWTGLQFAKNTPREVVLLIDRQQSPHQRYASAYQNALAERGIRLTIENHAKPFQELQGKAAGSAQHYAALSSPQIAESQPPANILALAAVAREPIWIVVNSSKANRIQDLVGLKLGFIEGDVNSRWVGEALMATTKMAKDHIRWTALPVSELVKMVQEEALDAVIVGAHPDANWIRSLARAPNLQLLSMEQLGPITQRLPQLKPSVLPRGAIELRSDIPSRDITLLSLRLHLLINPTMPAALQRELLDAARRVHERPSFMHRNGEFPNTVDIDLPASPTARAFTHGARPWLERMLPYGTAQLVEWLLIAALPLLTLSLVLLRWIPMAFDWRVNTSLQTFYGELKFLETEFDSVASERPIELKRLIQNVEDMERKVIELNLPEAYAERWYTLRQDLQRARERLLSLRSR